MLVFFIPFSYPSISTQYEAHCTLIQSIVLFVVVIVQCLLLDTCWILIGTRTKELIKRVFTIMELMSSGKIGNRQNNITVMFRQTSYAKGIVLIKID